MQLVQFSLIKDETAHHMGLIIGTGWSGNIGHKNFISLVNKQNVLLTSPVAALYATLTCGN